ncbi:MAG: hypothetical protein GX944_01400 [Alphaproteobacteria bacterium]|nr:hypothetical protein [Alphaproteobacteria bacterium]
MKKSIFIISLIVMPFAVNATGTYYTGNYQSPQYRYAQPNSMQHARYQNSGSQNSTWPPYPVATNYYQPKSVNTKKTNSVQNKFNISGGLSREVANWQMEMKNSGSILHYDNISWNVLDVNADYNFGMVKLDAGIKYGMQAGESHMIDDDITNGGYYIDTLYYDHDNNPLTEDEILGDVYGKTISAGISEGGNMLGFNIGLSLTDKFNIGKAKLTPSIGYRHFSYTLETNKNNGLSLQSGYCFVVPGSDETQCNPLIMIDEDNDGNIDSVIWDDYTLPIGEVYFGNTFEFNQPRTSHLYKTSWSGPFVALDLDYEINQYNALNARLEIGLPAYKSIGDQPYRTDWAHPKSIEDSAGIGNAWHIGLGADFLTTITDNVKLSLGFTYDYYSVNNADAKTFLNKNIDLESDPELQAQCPNWICTQKGEISSFYKSMGIRIGLNSQF